MTAIERKPLIGPANLAPSSTSASQRAVDGLDANFGVAPGRRAAHAKGIVATGTFVATPEAATLSRAGHLTGDPVSIVARFSSFPGGASHPDPAPECNPRGLAVQFRLRDGGTTDLLAHSINGFPGTTVDDFADFLAAIAPGGPGPESYMSTHESAARFVSAVQSHGSPVSFATLPYYAVNAFRFHDAEDTARHVRYEWVPASGRQVLSDAEAAAAGDDYLSRDLADRLAAGPVVFSLVVTVAEPGDMTEDANAVWPSTRRRVTLGELRLEDLAADSEVAEQGLFFDPVRLTDGITLSDDPLLVGRTRTYPMSLARRHSDLESGGGS